MDFNLASEVFKALGDPHRLRALHFLATATPDCCQGPDGVCACDLVVHLGLAQPTVSHHMRLLVSAGLVTASKRGRWTHYALSAEGFRAVETLLAQVQAQIVSVPPCRPAQPLSAPQTVPARTVPDQTIQGA